MSPACKTAAKCFTLVLLAGYASPEVQAAEQSSPVDPAAAHAENASYTMRNIDDGATLKVSLKLTTEGYVGEESDGCTWIQPEPYAPAISWNDCEGSTGTHRIIAEEGTLWPLAIGNRKTWRFEGQNQLGNSWKGRHSCEVQATETVTLDSGSFPSFRIHCRDPWTRKTYWYAPALGHTVYSQHHHKRRHENTVLEYTGEAAAS